MLLPRVALSLVIVLFVSFAVAAAAQDEPAAAPPSPAEIPLRQLELEIEPLRREALVAVAEEWIGHLQAKVAEINSIKKEAAVAEGDEKIALTEQAVAEADVRAALVERVDAILDELELKGGDVEEYRLYVTAVSDAALDLADTTSAWIYLRNWMTSPDGGVAVGLNILKAIGTLIAFWIVARFIGAIVRRASGRFENASTLLKNFIAKSVRRLVMLIGVVVAISMLGFNIGPLVAAIGAAGLVIGLALQGTLSNFASGLLILLYRPFDVGDWVNAGGVSGKVQSMSLLTTTILTGDNQVTIVPNNEIWDNVITNVTGSDTRRVDMTFGIGYPDDIDKAAEVLMQIVKDHPLVLDEPEPIIRVHELADSSVNFVVRPWAKTSDYWTVKWEVTAEVKRRFDKEGIGIPFPQMDVHLHQAAAEG